MRKRSTQWCINTIAALASLLIALIIAESLYARFEPAGQALLVRGHLSSGMYDPILGWKNRPNAREIFETRSFKTHVRINSDGMRDGPVGDKKMFTVAVMGDSVPWGWGVEEEERFTNILARNMNVEMLNFGVIGYNPVHYYLTVDSIIPYRPDMVLLVFTTFNDFHGVVSRPNYIEPYSPYGDIENGQLLIKGYPVPDYKQYNEFLQNRLTRFITQYALGRLIYVTIEYHFPKTFEKIFTSDVPTAPPPMGKTDFYVQLIYRDIHDPRVRHAANVTKELLRGIKQKLDRYHIPLVIFAAPTRAETLMSNRYNPVILLKEITDELGISLVSNVPMLDHEAYFIENDDHWTPLGHRHTADILKPVIQHYRTP